jgi:hypothetical protein
MKAVFVLLTLVSFGLTTQSQKLSESKITDTISIKNVFDIAAFLKSEITPLESLRKLKPKVSIFRSNNGTDFRIGLRKNTLTITHNLIKGKKNSVLVNGKSVSIRRLSLGEKFTFEDMVLDYSDASFCSLLSDSNLYLIVLKPTNFTGLMSNYSLYQILDVRNLKLFEFVSFGDYLEIISRRRSDNSFDILFLNGVHNVENDSWNIFITKHNTYQLENQLPISLSSSHSNYKCISIVQ